MEGLLSGNFVADDHLFEGSHHCSTSSVTPCNVTVREFETKRQDCRVDVMARERGIEFQRLQLDELYNLG